METRAAKAVARRAQARGSRSGGNGQRVACPENEVVATLRRTIGVDRTNARCGARDEGRIAPCEGSRLPPFIDDDRNLYSKHYDRHVICQGSRRKKVRGTMQARREANRERIVETAARMPHEAHRRRYNERRRSHMGDSTVTSDRRTIQPRRCGDSRALPWRQLRVIGGCV